MKQAAQVACFPHPKSMQRQKKRAKKKKEICWNGRNKRAVRAHKLALLKRAQEEGYLVEDPCMLTFAGAPAHFEKGAIARGICKGQNIITIQDPAICGSHDGESVLKALIDVRDNEIPDMYIWPSSFSSFSRCYTKHGVVPPIVRIGSKPKWKKNRRYHQEMMYTCDLDFTPMDVLDIDICGIFSPENAGDVAALFHNQVPAQSGYLFVNHLKGRDSRRGRIFRFLREYYEENVSYLDYEKIYEPGTEAPLSLEFEDEFSRHCFRYILAPAYYIIEAFKAGYHLSVQKLVEYRDLNPKSRRGVNMLQGFFVFERTDVATHGVSEEEDPETFFDLFEADFDVLTENLEYVQNQKYPHFELLK